MTVQSEARREVTVTFLPHRLNRQPVIVRGLTANELWITVGVSATGGLILGIVIAFLTRSVPMVPTLIAACVALGVFVGGGVLRRHKRGRPDTWIYRHLQWRLIQRVPTIGHYLGAGDLITRSGYWTTHRAMRR